MSEFVPTKSHLREVLLFYFNLKKKAAEGHRMLRETYGNHAPSISTCEYWFRRFKRGDFHTEDKERPGQPKKFEDEDLKALLDGDPCKTQEEYAKLLGVTQETISNRLKKAKKAKEQQSAITTSGKNDLEDVIDGSVLDIIPELQGIKEMEMVGHKSAKKRRREKHRNRYSAELDVSSKEHKKKRKKRSLDVEDLPHPKITIKIKPIPLPAGEVASESNPQCFYVPNETNDNATPPLPKSTVSNPKLSTELQETGKSHSPKTSLSDPLAVSLKDPLEITPQDRPNRSSSCSRPKTPECHSDQL